MSLLQIPRRRRVSPPLFSRSGIGVSVSGSGTLMMQSALSAALFCLCLAGAAGAQLVTPPDEGATGPQLRVMPWIGYLPAITRTEEWGYPDRGDLSFLDIDMRLGAGTAFGVAVEVPLHGRFGALASAGYAARGNSDFVVLQTGDSRRIDGNNVLLGRAGFSWHLPDEVSDLVVRRIGASAFAGGAVMYERPRDRFGLGDALVSATHYGIVFGFALERNFGDRFGVHVGVEDNMMWWDEAALASVPFEYFGRPGDSPAATPVDAGMSHVWMLRAGFSVRF